MRDFHDIAKKAAEDKDILALYQIAKTYEFWRETNNEPFPGADNEMTETIKSAITVNEVSQ